MKRMIALMLSVIMVMLMVAACGDAQTTTNTTVTTQTTTEATTAATTTATTEATTVATVDTTVATTVTTEATTVATTMIFAALAGIEVFVTGGIGGVHRGAETTFDISRDLQELANTNVTVVCAGAKAILDLPKTMEYLETMGVPVLGYKSSELGAFYSKESGLPVDYKMDSALDIAKAIKVKRELNLKGGVLISNPIKDEDSYPSEEINKVINQAVEDSIKENIVGKESTPFLLKRIVEYTGGKSLETNIKLVYNNAHVGSLISMISSP